MGLDPQHLIGQSSFYHSEVGVLWNRNEWGVNEEFLFLFHYQSVPKTEWLQISFPFWIPKSEWVHCWWIIGVHTDIYMKIRKAEWIRKVFLPGSFLLPICRSMSWFCSFSSSPIDPWTGSVVSLPYYTCRSMSWFCSFSSSPIDPWASSVVSPPYL